MADLRELRRGGFHPVWLYTGHMERCQHAFGFAGSEVEPFVRGVAVLLVYWLILFWMYRRKLFLKI